MNLHMNFPPFILQSCFSITWIEEFDAWFKNGLWLQRRWHFSRHQENNIMKKKHARHRSYSNFHPPFKIVIFTVGVKSVSKTPFLRSMGSVKKYVSYGAREAFFWVLQHLRSETPTFFSAFIPQRGAKNWKIAFLRSMGSKKKSASYGAWEAYFWVLQHLSSVLRIFWPRSGY